MSASIVTPDEIAELRAAMTPEERASVDALLDWEAPEQIHWRDWLSAHFPAVATAPMPDGGRHARLWEWFDALTPGMEPRARLEGWPRGGGKSTGAELGCVRLAETLKRRFVLYVCGTQDQADSHIQSIASWMEQRGIQRAVSHYGQPRGWNRQQVQTRNGFHAAAFGLDSALRGIKIREYRPDLIILDDIDSSADTPLIIRNKITAITTAILPTGSTDCAVLFVQNPIHEDSVFSQLCDGRADFLRDREVPSIEPALIGFEHAEYESETGRPIYRITAGTPTWDGQDVEACERLLNKIGLRAFKRECQHDLGEGSDAAFFDVPYLRSILPTLPEPIRVLQPGEYGLGGTLKLYRDRRNDRGDLRRCVIGADPSQGIKELKSDFCAAVVLDVRSWEVCAVYHGKPTARPFAIDLGNLSEQYNRAEVIIENNDAAFGVIEFAQELGVPLWENDPDDQDTDVDETDTSVGFRTGGRSKATIDGGLQDAIIDASAGRRSIVLADRDLVEELIHYVYLRNYKRGGERGWHDDLVRALGLAWHLAKEYGQREEWTPRPQPRNPYVGIYRHRGT